SPDTREQSGQPVMTREEDDGISVALDPQMASKQFGLRPGLQCLTPATSCLGIIPNTVSQPCIPPNRDDWDHLFQPMFDEYYNPLTFVVSLVPVAAAPRAVDLADSPVSTSIDQDALSTSILSTQEQEHSTSISQGAVDPTLFTQKAGNDLLLVQVYVDDILFAFTNTAMCNEFANQMTTIFKMSMMGQIKSKLDEDLQGKPIDATLYRGMIGSLMYLTSSRPDLTYAVCFCARYQAKPTEKHLNTVKQIFRYLKGTINIGLWYSKDTGMSPTAYADADHTGCQDTRRSTSGSAQFLGDKNFSWSSKKQKSTAISSTEAEYIALSAAKRIDVRYNFIKEQVENGIVKLYFFRTEYQLADIFTKALPIERFNFSIEKLGMRSMYPETLKIWQRKQASDGAFQITAEVPEIYMHQFWNTIKKIGKSYAYDFKLDKKKCLVDTE
nr:hypothetical protein [Tanacetum cinerariifolium]